MDDVDAGDIIGIQGMRYLVERILPRGLYVRSLRDPAFGQFFSDHDMHIARLNGMSRLRPDADARTASVSSPEIARLERVRRSVAGAVCDAALRCVGTDPVPVSRAHRELLASLDGEKRAACYLPSVGVFRNMVKHMSGEASAGLDGPLPVIATNGKKAPLCAA